MSEQFEELEIEDALSAAVRVLQRVKNAEGYDELASMIALRYALKSEFIRAVEIADTINDPFTLDKTIGEVAIMVSAAGQDDGAFELLESIDELSHQATATSQIAIAHAASGNFDRAIEVASAMEDNASTLVEIVYQCTAKEELDRALDVIEIIDVPLFAVLARANVAGKYLENGRIEEALEFLSQAREFAGAVDPPNDKTAALAELALKYHEAGEVSVAAEILAHALEVATRSDEIYRDAALSHIASAHARLKQYDDAVSVTEKIDAVYQATSTLIDIAGIEHEEVGRQTEALQLLSDAYDLVFEDVPQNQSDENFHNHLLMRIALQYALCGESEQALKAAKSIGGEESRHGVLSRVASQYATGGNLDDALTTARAIEDKTYRARTLIGISRSLIASEKSEKGIEILNEAESLVDELESESDRILVLSGLAIAFGEAGQVERIPVYVSNALADTKLITNDYQKTFALISIAEACAKTEFEFDEESKELLWEM